MRVMGLGGDKEYPSTLSLKNRIGRFIWEVVYLVLFRPTPKYLHGWRMWLLRVFGARIGRGAAVHPSVKIWAPWNLEMGDVACLGPYVDCYNVDRISVGAYCTVSQYSYLCGATHDYTKSTMPLIPMPIHLGNRVWVAADAFIGPGVTVGEGAVVGARSSVYQDVEPWTVVAGNPARFLKRRVLDAGHEAAKAVPGAPE